MSLSLYLGAVAFYLGISLLLRTALGITSKCFASLRVALGYLMSGKWIKHRDFYVQMRATEGRIRLGAIMSCVVCVFLGILAIVTGYIFLDGEARLVFLVSLVFAELLSATLSGYTVAFLWRIIMPILGIILHLIVGILLTVYRLTYALIGRFVFSQGGKKVVLRKNDEFYT